MTERTDGVVLRRLARINPTTAFLAAFAVLLGGLFAPGVVGATLLLVVAGAAGALTFTTWPVQRVGARAMRLVVLTALVAGAVAKLV